MAVLLPKNLKKIVTGLPKVGEGESVTDPGCFKCKKNCHACRENISVVLTQAGDIKSNRRCRVNQVL